MKKQYRKIASYIISIIMLMTSLVVPSFAQEAVSAQDSMRRLAEQTISIVIETVDDSTKTTYKNIEDFIEKVRCICPDISDLEIAKFVLHFTNQSTENLPDEILLRALEAREVTQRTDYIEVDSSGEQRFLSQQELQQALSESICQDTASPQDVWISSNGYMKIETTATFKRKEGIHRYYTVTAKADWLKMPVCFFEDVLVIAHTGKFDSSVKEFGYKYQTNSCCESTFRYNLSTNFPNEKISFDYPSTTGTALRFKLQIPVKCSKQVIAHLKVPKSISAYLTYGIIVDEAGTLNVKSAYCHKEVALGSISVSCVSASISFSLTGLKHDYNARIITVEVI